MDSSAFLPEKAKAKSSITTAAIPAGLSHSDAHSTIFTGSAPGSVASTITVCGFNFARHQSTNEHAQSQREEDQHALGLGANFGRGDFVGVDLACDEEEVVANAVQQDAADHHPDHTVVRAKGEHGVPNHPGDHAHEQRGFDAVQLQEDGQSQHEEHFGHLPQRHFGGGVFHPSIGDEAGGHLVVERQRNADQERADHEDKEGAILQKRHRVQTNGLRGG